jgi:hypothetical protein
MPTFNESLERIQRASRHAQAFAKGISEFLTDAPYSIKPERRGENSGVIRLIPRKHPDRELPLLLGEFFYQLRAALDAAMWEAFVQLGDTKKHPQIKVNRIYFPIYQHKKDFEKSVHHNIALKPELRNWLASIQPCNPEQRSAASEEEQISTALSTINECSRKDRHRKLHLVGATVISSDARIRVDPPARVKRVENIPADPFGGQYEIAEFEIEGANPNTQLEFVGEFTIQPSVNEIPNSVDLWAQLQRLTLASAKVITRFEEAFR